MALKSRILGLVVAAGLLTACGSVHPGAAAVVNGERISMGEANDAAHGLCVIGLVGQQEGSSVDNGQVRRQALATLIVGEAAEQIVAERGLKVVEADNEEYLAQVEQFREMLDEADRPKFDKLIEQNLHFGAVAVAVARDSNPDEKNEDLLAQAGAQEIISLLDEMDIDIDPRFAMNPIGEQFADSGSLSVPTVNLEAPAEGERSPLTQCTNIFS